MTARQIVLYCLALIPVTVFPAVLGISGWRYVIATIVLNATFTWCGFSLARSHRGEDCRRLFWAPLGYLLCLLPAMVLDHL